MYLLNADSALDYLRAHNFLERDEPATATALTGGVSNQVIMIRTPLRAFVMKQPLQLLRVAEGWRIDTRRILIERDCMILLTKIVPGGVPKVIFSDDDNLIFAMSAVDENAVLWKDELMAGRVSETAAAKVGEFLANVHRLSHNMPEVADRFEELRVFHEGRIFPYHLTAAERNPDVAPQIIREIKRMLNTRQVMVHGDFSPKNIFISPDGSPCVLDFEIAHYGDPTFDIAFCLNHLMIKAFHFASRFDPQLYLRAAERLWNVYRAGLDAEMANHVSETTGTEIGCLMLARVDGLSPVEYVTDVREKEQLRVLAKSFIRQKGVAVCDIIGLVGEACSGNQVAR